ncbi:Acetylornithine/Succinylornithine transaminase family [Acididesulfobacillus acetoxydans]|uniref:Acetylornithine aminotransferase n=1 Tax=Acididesulfobacillus acetoxydans TaxID=1561005 RepID=A0A8S0W224_9FIRM|nr:aspartate aminotransferase family protein [Acididesulfobacillus acetoxydans]CAA7600278.1 Acetylornithine/Succinylornithine transaminase family [Acididesulfobacillus acetoxydans]CEJ06054.1 Acetylornithine aminotransferase [Acididesulfobacillus acetoxydans]
MLEGLSTAELVAKGQAVVMNTYGRLPLALVRGEGSWVWDVEGTRYLDFVTGLAVNSLGYGHPAIVQAIQKQAKEILHTSNLYWIPNQIALAERLAESSFASKVFFCNSGAEANEAAIKLARKYAKKKYGEDKFEIISLKNSFHGRTLATLTATGQTKYQQGFAPLPEGFSYVEINNLGELKERVNEKTAALLIEPIQGEGGVFPASEEFLRAARELCDQYGALLIFDEVQVGLGRTGKLFAHEWSGVAPDIMTLAKALGGGVPIGAMLAGEEAAAAFQPGDHASTFGGNPLATAVGCAVLDVMRQPGFLEDVRERALYFRQGLEHLAEKYKTGESVRGQGFILGWPLPKLGGEVVQLCRERGLLVNCIGGKTLRFLPPLTVSKEEIDQALGILDRVLSENWK